MVLADAYLEQGEVEQACQVALSALEIGEQLKSARCGAYVEEFRDRLARVGNTAIVRAFVEQASTTRLWTPQDARTVPSPDGSPPVLMASTRLRTSAAAASSSPALPASHRVIEISR